jgi:dihydropyrimidinase/dihydroorotase
MELVIKDGKVVTSCGIIKGGVAVKDGKIAKVGGNASLPDADRVIDAKGNFVIPGFVEVHSHIGIGGPGSPQGPFDERWKNQFRTETEGAIHGGVTTVRTNLAKSEPYLPIIDRYIKWAETNSYIDFGIYPTVIAEEHIDELVPMAEKGMPSWKCFYNPYQDEEGKQVGLAHTDAGKLYRALETYAQWGYPGLVMFHAENYDLYTMLQERLIKAQKKDLKAWSDSRPNICEAMMLESAAMITQETDGTSYVVHMSTGEGVDICEKYQKRGVRVIAETLPCFLTHTKHMQDEYGVWGKINPPFREKSDIARMWEGLRTGVVTHIGTDHCAYSREEKEQGLGKYGDIWKALPGLSGGMEHWLPIMFTEGFNKGRLTIDQIVKVCSTNNAKTFGIYPQKGVIQEGSDADIVIVDPNKKLKIDEKYYHCINKDYSPYWGWKIKGAPVMTISRGEVLVEDGRTVAKPGRGKYTPSQRY